MHRVVNEFIGIDPGKTGGLVCLDREGDIVECTKMPVTETDIWKWFVQFPQSTPSLVEWIHPAIQGIGKSSMSKLYGNYMQLRGYLIARHMRWEDVKPRKWQQSLGISPKKKTENRNQWKNRLKAHAQQLFPQEKVTLATADALLIAEHCRRTWK